MSVQREEGHFLGYDETELFWQSWLCPQPKASIIVTHGLGEHSESYIRLAEGIIDGGYQTYAWDLRGHGRSPGKRGVVSSFDEYIRDLKLFVEFVRPRLGEKPFFVLGHSMGGLVLLKYLIRNGLNWAQGVVLSSPLLSLTLEIPGWKKTSAKFLATLAPDFTLANGIADTQLTTDKSVLRQYSVDTYRHDRCSTTLYLGMLENMEYVKSRVDKVPGPLYMQVSGKDTVVSQKACEDFYENLPIPNKQKTVYENMLHEVYNETQRQRPFTDLKRWLDHQLEAKS